VARVIGIDLGTTNTLAAWADGRVPRIIPTERGHSIVPSVVAYVGERVLVGHPARDQLLLAPRDTIVGAKRLVGRSYFSPVVQELRSRFAYEVVEGDRGEAAVRAGGRVRSLVEIQATVLQQIARYATTHLGGPLDGVVISVPAYYPQNQRDAVRRAASEAGLDVWRLVNEPTAAALAYGIMRRLNQRLLVFDLGGGTFDVSILDVQDGTFEVLSTGGDGALGGVDFDIRLTDHLLARFQEAEGIDLRDDPVVLQRLLFAAETAKQDLSLLQHVEVRLPFVATRRGKPVDLSLHVSRSQLVELCGDLIERCIGVVDDVLGAAGFSPGDVDEVLLAGGQTRMPAIQGQLEAYFGKGPRRGVNPDEVVAQGAALLARSLAAGEVRLLDALGASVGVVRRKATVAGAPALLVVDEIIKKNTTLPAKNAIEIVIHPEARKSGKGGVHVDLVQGTDRDPRRCEPLGSVFLDEEAILSTLGDPASTVRLDLDVEVDTDGLPVVAWMLPTGRRELPLRPTRPGYLEAPAGPFRAVRTDPGIRVPGFLRDGSKEGAEPRAGFLQRLLRR
jgi:molecular chaperone DnaK